MASWPSQTPPSRRGCRSRSRAALEEEAARRGMARSDAIREAVAAWLAPPVKTDSTSD
ncbi:ribbon-helix-helix domain-containing protein [Xanthobacter albus]|uniref:ribbon-helix-helix domain-containing protein n=1 Tax=Xanthobacter albus TaxID=3119929 RepID=UPI00372D49C6